MAPAKPIDCVAPAYDVTVGAAPAHYVRSPTKPFVLFVEGLANEEESVSHVLLCFVMCFMMFI